MPANYAVNATGLASRRLQGKRRATRPARYRGRYTDTGTMNDQRPCPRLLVGLAIPLGRTQTRTTTSASVSGCHARRPEFTQASRNLNTLWVRRARRQWHVFAAADAQDYAAEFPYNHAVNASVRPVTPLAFASVAPVRPARYRARYTDTGTVNDEAPRMKRLIHGASPSRTRRIRRTSSASVSGWHARRPLFTQATQSPNTLVVQLSSRHWQALAGVDAQNYVEDFPYNHAVNASVRPVTPLAVASVAPVRPARYRGR